MDKQKVSTVQEIKELKPQSKDYTVSTTTKGLAIVVKPDGNKIWIYRFTSPTTKKQRKTTIGNLKQTSQIQYEW